MPKEMERKLKMVAAKMVRQGKLKKQPDDTLEEAKNRFVYGILRHKMGWTPKGQRK